MFPLFAAGGGHQRRQRRRCRHHVLRPEGAVAMPPRSDPRPVASRAPAPAPIRLFVCMGRDCRAERGGTPLIEAVRHSLAEAGAAAAHLSALSCPCLDRCEDGPLILAYGGEAAALTRPPTGPQEPQPLAIFTHVRRDQLPALITRLLSA